jgi:hypothetical protein
MAITRGTILLLAILTLTSCVRRHSSRDEAQKASIAWINQGGTVTVLTLPNENEIKAQWRRERIAENNKCEFAKQEIEDLERSVPPDNFEENEIQAKYKDLIATRDDTCRDRKILVEKIDLADKQEEKKRECKTTNNQCNSFAQKKIYRLVMISKEDWDKWPQKQSYFAYK